MGDAMPGVRADRMVRDGGSAGLCGPVAVLRAGGGDFGSKLASEWRGLGIASACSNLGRPSSPCGRHADLSAWKRWIWNRRLKFELLVWDRSVQYWQIFINPLFMSCVSCVPGSCSNRCDNSTQNDTGCWSSPESTSWSRTGTILCRRFGEDLGLTIHAFTKAPTTRVCGEMMYTGKLCRCVYQKMEQENSMFETIFDNLFKWQHRFR